MGGWADKMPPLFGSSLGAQRGWILALYCTYRLGTLHIRAIAVKPGRKAYITNHDTVLSEFWHIKQEKCHVPEGPCRGALK